MAPLIEGIYPESKISALFSNPLYADLKSTMLEFRKDCFDAMQFHLMNMKIPEQQARISLYENLISKMWKRYPDYTKKLKRMVEDKKKEYMLH